MQPNLSIPLSNQYNQEAEEWIRKSEIAQQWLKEKAGPPTLPKDVSLPRGQRELFLHGLPAAASRVTSHTTSHPSTPEPHEGRVLPLGPLWQDQIQKNPCTDQLICFFFPDSSLLPHFRKPSDFRLQKSPLPWRWGDSQSSSLQ